MENLSSLSRIELHERACDAIAAEGRKPSVGTVRAWTLANVGIKRGSDGDAQADINAWFARLLALKRQKPIPDVPPALADSFGRLWSAALEAALATVIDERRALDHERVQVQRLVADADAKSRQLADDLGKTNAQIALLQEKLAGREEMIAQLDAQLTEQRAAAAGKDERINALAADIARISADHKTQIDVLTAYEKKTEARLAAHERRALLEIDKARTAERESAEQLVHTRESAARKIESYRIRTSTAETELATLRGRSNRLEEEILSSAGRITQLEKELSREREAAAALAVAQPKGATPARRLTNQRLRPAVMVRRRKP